MPRVIFFVDSPFCQRDYKRYGMDVFLQNGFDIMVWDLSLALHPQLQGKFILSDQVTWHKHIIFKTKQEVVAALNQCPNDTYIINTLNYNGDTFCIYRALSKNNIPYFVTAVSVFLPFTLNSTIKSKLLRYLKVFNPNKLKSYVLQRLPLRYLNILPAKFVIAEGLKCNIKRPEVASTTKMVRTHSLDYDIYLSLKNNPVNNPDNTWVYLDNYLVYHSDALFSGEKLPITPKRYYKELCQFFDVLEKNHQCKIIIAAHPRSQYDTMPDLFDKRPVIKGKTAELVQQAKAVIVSFSTSITFPVLYKKPIIFFTTDELNNYRITQVNYMKLIHDLAALFGKKPINISSAVEDDLKVDLRMDDVKYNDYCNHYIKAHGSDDLPFWQIICNEINADQKQGIAHG